MSNKPSELSPVLRLNGVDHSARPTWKLRETVEFYRDKLGIPLVHAITAKGWGRAKEPHADFIHFFFEAGRAARSPFSTHRHRSAAELMVPRGYMAMANHTAWRVETEEELLAWQKRLEARGRAGQPVDQARDPKSIYFRDPNHYPLEITRPLRAVERIDGIDAELTMAAALDCGRRRLDKYRATLAPEGEARRRLSAKPGDRAVSGFTFWMFRSCGGGGAARKLDSCRVHAVRRGYIYVEFDGAVEIERAATNLSEAVWFGC